MSEIPCRVRVGLARKTAHNGGVCCLMDVYKEHPKRQQIIPWEVVHQNLWWIDPVTTHPLKGGWTLPHHYKINREGKTPSISGR